MGKIPIKNCNPVKIDFIVWKHDVHYDIFNSTKQLKIDFIVWKQEEIQAYKKQVIQFKIDFIVWKLIIL